MSDRSRGCCYYFCKCFYNSEEETNNQDNNNNQRNNQIVVVNNQQSISNNIQIIEANSSVGNNDQNQQQNANNSEEDFNEKFQKVVKKFKIQTVRIKTEIVGKDYYFKELDNKYNCSICLKFLNFVLKLSCCKNYICVFCSEEYITTTIKYEFPINCPFCGISNKTIIVEDINENDPIKDYSDSLPEFKKSMKTIKSVNIIEENKKTEGSCDKNKIDDKRGDECAVINQNNANAG